MSFCCRFYQDVKTRLHSPIGPLPGHTTRSYKLACDAPIPVCRAPSTSEGNYLNNPESQFQTPSKQSHEKRKKTHQNTTILNIGFSAPLHLCVCFCAPSGDVGYMFIGDSPLVFFARRGGKQRWTSASKCAALGGVGRRSDNGLPSK